MYFNGLNFVALGIFAVIGILFTIYGVYSIIVFLISHLTWV
jgi:hypothetical protein